MNWSDTFSWWAALRGKRAAADDADRADMGTAFGLDASFDAAADGRFDAAPALAAATPPSPFESRLIRRSGL